jgi:hypothetical protein
MTLELEQQAGFSGVAFNCPGAMNFYLGQTAADEIVDSGPGTASVINAGIQILTNGDTFLTPGSYTLIDVPSGGLTDKITLETSPTVTVGGVNYFLSLVDTPTSVVLNVSVPEPASAAVFGVGGIFVLARRRRREGAH